MYSFADIGYFSGDTIHLGINIYRVMIAKIPVS